MFDAVVTLEGYGSSWKTGVDIIDIVLTLGQQDNSSTVVVSLADPENAIAAALIQHSLDNGGIRLLPKPVKTVGDQSKTPTIVNGNVVTMPAGNGIVSSGDLFTPQVQAFADLIAWHEVPIALGEQGYYSLNFSGYFSNEQAKSSFPSGVGHKQNVGRYQFNYGDVQDAINNGYSVPDYSPKSQDQVLLFKLKFRHVLAPLQAGDIRTAILNGGQEWASLPGASIPQESPGSQVPAGYTTEMAIAYYNMRLKYYQGLSPSVPQVPKVEQSTAVATSTQKSGADVILPIVSPVMVKGGKLVVAIDDYVYSFIHQETETSEAGITKVHGTGVRYALNRRKKNESHSNATLKQVATKIANAHHVTLNYLANFDPEYIHLDQTGISDYELLKRECEQCGLFMSEDNTGITIKELKQIKQTDIVLSPGVNLISYDIKDKAMDTSKEPAIDSLLQGENKVTIDAITGQMSLSKPDIDPVKDASVTGREKPQITGKLSTLSAPVAAQNRGRVKRVRGLPSVFKIALTAVSLGIAPLSMLTTHNLKGCLNRAWMVDKVTHNLAEGTTTLNCSSPIEVVDNTPPIVASSTPTPTSTSKPTGVSFNGFVVPVGGVITSYFHELRKTGEVHPGTDIANDIGTPITASADGIITFEAYSGGYGNVIFIKHSNGYETRYGHMSKFVARLGQMVKQGETIGLIGSTGYSTGPHCHFEIRNPAGTVVSPATVGLGFLVTSSRPTVVVGQH